MGTDRQIGSERDCSSTELPHRIHGRWGYVSSLSSPSSCGGSTQVLLKGSSQCKCSQSNGNWVEVVPLKECLHPDKVNGMSL